MTWELPWITEPDLHSSTEDEGGAAIVSDDHAAVERAVGGEQRAGIAVQPYPVHLINRLRLPDGTDVVIRPIRPEDARIEQEFVRRLSDRARYLRFMQSLRELTPGMLARSTQIDYDREMALIAVVHERGREEEIAVCRYAAADASSCEFAVAVADAWQRRGIGRRLMVRLMEAARGRGLRAMEGDILATNREMIALARSLEFTIAPGEEDPRIRRARRQL